MRLQMENSQKSGSEMFSLWDGEDKYLVWASTQASVDYSVSLGYPGVEEWLVVGLENC